MNTPTMRRLCAFPTPSLRLTPTNLPNRPPGIVTASRGSASRFPTSLPRQSWEISSRLCDRKLPTPLDPAVAGKRPAPKLSSSALGLAPRAGSSCRAGLSISALPLIQKALNFKRTQIPVERVALGFILTPNKGKAIASTFHHLESATRRPPCPHHLAHRGRQKLSRWGMSQGGRPAARQDPNQRLSHVCGSCAK